MALTPYVVADEFRAHPTYLDTETLRPGIMDPSAQTDELVNMLLGSSDWADNECNQPLSAHRVDRHTRGRIEDGNLIVYPSDRPVLSIAAVSYGSTISRMSYVVDPAFRVDDNQTIYIPVGGAARGRVWVDLTYTAGHVATVVDEDAASGADSLTVMDPTGIVPGGSYRLWEPSVEEFVVVSPSWTPPAIGTPITPVAVPLATPTLNPHTAGFSFSGMPADMRLAVINYTVAQLMRPDTSAEDAFPDTNLSPGTRKKDPRKDGSGLVAEASRILNSYARRM
ncbi:hypothetical protein ACUXZZ_45560 (plasmid) [Streptomyces graminifolii]|uniref:hypothetical protein n=1 Tax=Streptomyces graminifolii TaxID=1266771 RepID=UPI004059D42D